MKKHKTLAAAIGIVLLQALGVPSSHAQELYKVCVRVACLSTNESGRVVHRTLTNRDFIRKCAREQGLTNATGLSLAFNRTDSSLQVVGGTNHAVLCTPLSFSGGVSLGNSDNTKVERMAFVFVDASAMANGTLVATERYRYGSSNQVTRFSLIGKLHYSVPANGTNSPAIYTGSIVAGSGFFFRHHDDDDDDQGEDDNNQGQNRGQN